MSDVATRHPRIPRLSRFGWLMGLYTENHALLTKLFAPAALPPGVYASSVGDGLDVRLEVIARHAYTSELRLTYDFADPVTGERDPSAFVRYYRDACQAEATHCYLGRRWQDVIGLNPPPVALYGHRLRMNTFLGKWLGYLADRGHGVATLVRTGDLEPEVATVRSGSVQPGV